MQGISEFFSRKRTSSEETDSHRDQEASGDAQNLTHTTVDEEHQKPQKKKPHLTPYEKKRIYKAKLSYKRMGKEISLGHKDPSDGMFCETCLKWGNPPAGSRGAWKTRGITDWNHDTELLK